MTIKNNTIQKQQDEEDEEAANPFDYEVHITTIVGPPAEHITNQLLKERSSILFQGYFCGRCSRF